MSAAYEATAYAQSECCDAGITPGQLVVEEWGHPVHVEHAYDPFEIDRPEELGWLLGQTEEAPRATLPAA